MKGMLEQNQNDEFFSKQSGNMDLGENIIPNSTRVDYSKIKTDVRDVLGKFFYKETESKPMIITVIQEV